MFESLCLQLVLSVISGKSFLFPPISQDYVYYHRVYGFVLVLERFSQRWKRIGSLDIIAIENPLPPVSWVAS